ncbi:hypothetical protein TNCV_337951 [Trichonephila clavipes]|nr:hypothetical protein TNCV_337951 [Trichonephila clavipes]
MCVLRNSQDKNHAVHPSSNGLVERTDGRPERIQQTSKFQSRFLGIRLSSPLTGYSEIPSARVCQNVPAPGGHQTHKLRDIPKENNPELTSPVNEVASPLEMAQTSKNSVRTSILPRDVGHVTPSCCN